MSTALKRVEAWLLNSGAVGWTNQIGRYISAEDLRAVLKLAREAAELRRRVRLARRLLSPLGKRYGEPADVPLFDVDRALDLRKPLPRSRR